MAFPGVLEILLLGTTPEIARKLSIMPTAVGLAALLVFLLASPAWTLTGREVIDEAQARNGFSNWDDRRSLVTMESFDAGGSRIRDVTVYERTDPRGEHRTFMEFTAPHDVRGTRFLHVSPRDAPDAQWMWVPTLRRVRRLGDAQRDENFFGADLSYRDLELIVRIQQWGEREAESSLEGVEPCGQTECHRVGLRPKSTREFPYSRYRLWFTKDTFLLDRVEVYDLKGRLFKTIGCQDYFATGRFMTPRTCIIRNELAGTRTVVTFKDAVYDTGLSESLFRISHLSETL